MTTTGGGGSVTSSNYSQHDRGMEDDLGHPVTTSVERHVVNGKGFSENMSRETHEHLQRVKMVKADQDRAADELVDKKSKV